jgi:hypothetical protein
MNSSKYIPYNSEKSHRPKDRYTSVYGAVSAVFFLYWNIILQFNEMYNFYIFGALLTVLPAIILFVIALFALVFNTVKLR